MSIGIGQIIIIVLVILIVFGKLPNLFEEVASGIKTVKEAINKEQGKIESGSSGKNSNSINKKEDN